MLSDAHRLRTGLQKTIEQLDEVVVHCQLSSLATEPAVLQLNNDLLEERRAIEFYKSLSHSISIESYSESCLLRRLLGPSWTGPMYSPVLNAVTKTRASLIHISRTLTQAPTIYSVEALHQVPEGQRERLAGIEAERAVLSQHILLLHSAFRTFWAAYLSYTTHSEPETEPQSPILDVLSKFRKRPFSINLTDTNEKDFDTIISLARSQTAVNELMSNLEREGDKWAESTQSGHTPLEVLGTISVSLWCGPFDHAQAVLDRCRSPNESSDSFSGRRFRTFAQLPIARSCFSRNLVVPCGYSLSGKDTIINALFGASILPPYGRE